mmetsp:Transcript_8959/g.13776  ORF Transcript_8959/g.13776 Transcript_8959/m.13776 type:complete len:93 (+) Transcript_8959:414-692(+)
MHSITNSALGDSTKKISGKTSTETIFRNMYLYNLAFWSFEFLVEACAIYSFGYKTQNSFPSFIIKICYLLQKFCLLRGTESKCSKVIALRMQ